METHGASHRVTQKIRGGVQETAPVTANGQKVTNKRTVDHHYADAFAARDREYDAAKAGKMTAEEMSRVDIDHTKYPKRDGTGVQTVRGALKATWGKPRPIKGG